MDIFKWYKYWCPSFLSDKIIFNYKCGSYQMKIFCTILILFSSIFYGCFTASYYAEYQIFLAQVERPLNAVQLYGDPIISNILLGPKYKFSFEDKLVRINWYTDSRQILLKLENKTNRTIIIPWDEAAYVDPDGFSHRVIHISIDYNDKEKPQPPSVIVRNEKLEESILPSDYIKWTNSSGDASSPNWLVQPFLYDYVTYKPSKEFPSDVLNNFKGAVNLNISKDYQVLLPLKIDGITYEYIFTFRIEGIKVNTD